MFSKRKKTNEDDNNVSQIKKAKESDAFDAAKFKYMLKNVDTTFLALEKFVDACVGYPELKVYDIVNDYIQNSPDCVEIFNLIDGKTPKSSEVTNIFQALESILIRTGDDLAEKHGKVGESLVNHLIGTNSKHIYQSLNMQNKPDQLKSILKLMTSMVIQGDNSALSVLSLFDEKNQYRLISLYKHKNISVSQDVRTCTIHFIVSFLLSGSNSIIRQLMKKTVLLQNIFYGISYDKADLIAVVLQIFHEKVIENPGINKSMKVAIFNANILRELTQLYFWCGRQKWHGSKKNGAAENQNTVCIEDKTLVVEVVHKFLLTLCCSFKHGIVYLDKTIGTGKIDHNITLNKMLLSLQHPYRQPLLNQLVNQVLRECPDLLQHYLPYYQHSVSPRLSVEWIKCMNFILEIYENLPEVSNKVTFENTPVTKLVSMTTTLILPPEELMKQLARGIKNEDILVRHKIMELYKLILHRAIKAIDFVEIQKTVNQSINWQEFTDRFKEVILKVIPSIKIVMNCWNLTLNSNSHDNSQLSKQINSVFPVITVTQHLVLLEQFLCLNQQLVPGIILNHPALLTALLDGVGTVTYNVKVNTDIKVEEDIEAEKNSSLLQLYLLKIFSDSDARLLPWKRESKDGQSLMHQLLGMLTRSSSLLRTTKQLICKLLQSTGLFEDENDELSIWLKHLAPCNKQASLKLSVLARILNRYISNPYHYIHILTEIISSDLPPSGEIETASIGSTDSIIDSILEMDDEEITESDRIEENLMLNNQVNSRLPFSPVIVAAMEMIKCKEENYEEIKKFVCEILPDLFHTQVDPDSIRSLVQHYEDLLRVDSSVEYITSWKTSNQLTDDQTDIRKHVSELLMSVPVAEKLPTDKFEIRLVEKIVTMETEDLVMITQQILLYLGESIRKFSENQKDNEKRIQLYFRILQKIISKLDNKMTTEQIEIQDEHLQLLGSKYQQKRNDKKIVLIYILRCKTLQSLFLYTEESGLFGGVSKSSRLLSKFITPPLLQIIENSANSLDTPELEVLKCSYADKILGKFAAISGNLDKSLIIKCIKSLVPYLEIKYQKQFLLIVLNLSESIIVDKKSKEMTETGNLVIHLLSKMLENTETLFRKLSMDQASKLCNCLAVTEDDNLIKLCSDMLNINPGFSLACSEELWHHLLENSSDKMEDIMLRLFNNNCVCRRLFEDWLIKANGTSQSKWSSKVKNSIDVISKVYGSHLPQITNIQDSKDLEIIQQLVLKNRYNKKEMEKMWKSISLAVEDSILLQSDHSNLLQALYTQLVILDTSYRETLVLLCMKMLINQVIKKCADEDLKHSLLNVLTEHIPMCSGEVFETELREIWAKFIKSCLKTLYLEPKLINIIICCLTVVYQEGSCDHKLPIKSLYDMVMSHSKFLLVLFGDYSPELKDTVISLLLNIAERSHDCHDSAHIRIFLGVYGASLSISDQKLLKLLHLYETRSADISQYKPFLFGQKALDLYSSTKYQTPSVLKDTKMADFLECLDETRLYRSSLNFPIYRKLTPTEVKVVSDMKSDCELYDPSFLLPVFNQLLQTGVVVNCKQFINSHSLSFVFAGLSSYVTNIRQASYLILKNFYILLEKSEFPEAGELLHLFDVLRQSIETPNMKLCTVITVFLSRMAKILVNPDDHMYRKLTTFLVSRPTLEFDRVPGFYRFFNSSELDHHQERIWMLSLMADGVRTFEDYTIYGHLYCFKLLESYFTSCVSDLLSQGRILKIINSACLDVESVISLYQNNNILTWLLTVIEALKSGSSNVQQVSNILYNVWFTVKNSLPADFSLDDIPIAFIHQIIQCLKSLLGKLSSEDNSSFTIVLKTLNSLLQATDFKHKQSDAVNIETLALKDINLILLFLGKYNFNARLSGHAKKVLNELGIETKSVICEMERHSAVAVEFSISKETMRDAINVCLYWTPCSSLETNLNVDTFLSAMSCFLDYCSKGNDIEFIVRVLRWVQSVIVNGTEIALKSLSVLTTDIELSSNVIGYYLKLYSCGNAEFKMATKTERTSDNLDKSVSLVTELNKILIELIRHQETKSDCKKSAWKLCLQQLEVMKCDNLEELTAIFVQEYFLEAKEPTIFRKVHQMTNEYSLDNVFMEKCADKDKNVLDDMTTKHDQQKTPKHNKIVKTPKSSCKKVKKV